MSQSSIARYLNPWKYRREQEELQRVTALRQRDGDDCRRCRRLMRFDLPSGHDLGPRAVPVASDDPEGFDNLCLTHVRCNAQGANNTDEVKERVQRRNEAELLSRTRKRA